jgi:hypothetical protein
MSDRAFATHEETGLPCVEAAGEPRVLGCLPPERPSDKPKLFATNAVGAPAVIPRDQWKECDLTAGGWGTEIYDQDGQGSCVGHGAAVAFNIAYELSGQPPQRFSPCFLYSLINRGRDQGAIVEDALDALTSVGVCLESTVGPKAIYPRQYDAEKAKAEAARFRVEQAYKLDSFDEIGSAVQRGFAVAFGIEIGNAFEPGPDGVVPDRRGGGGGHCMCAVGVKQVNGRWYLLVVNSWSTRWGNKGYCLIPESYFTGYVDAFAVQAARLDSNGQPLPQPAAA